MMQGKINAIQESGLSLIDKDYLDMLVEALNSEDLDQSNIALDKIDEWYEELSPKEVKATDLMASMGISVTNL